MNNFKEEFERRKSEIDEYLKMLEAMERDGASITDLDGNAFALNVKNQTVAKASFYLIIYNLVEATVTAGVSSIYERIADERLTFFQIVENLRKIWWTSRQESLTSCARNNLIDTVYSIFLTANSDSVVDFGGFISGVSGNLDADAVRGVCHRYKIRPVADGRALQDVKQKRNWLAHGNKSFSEIGKDATISDLNEIRERTYIFLNEFVENVSAYLVEKRYKIEAA